MRDRDGGRESGRARAGRRASIFFLLPVLGFLLGSHEPCWVAPPALGLSGYHWKERADGVPISDTEFKIFFEDTAAHAELFGIHPRPDDGLHDCTGDGDFLPWQICRAHLARRRPVVALNTVGLIDPVTLERDDELVEVTKDVIRTTLETLRLDYFGVGVESNAIDGAPHASPELFAARAELIDELLLHARAVPGTLGSPELFTVYAYESLLALEDQLGVDPATWLAQIPSVDFVAITMYPWIRHGTVQSIPSNYLDPLEEWIDEVWPSGDGFFGIQETGWPSRVDHAPVAPGLVGGEAAQVAYIDRLFTSGDAHLLYGRRILFVNWLGLHDIDNWRADTDGVADGREIFGSMGLLEWTDPGDGLDKPAAAAWRTRAGCPCTP